MMQYRHCKWYSLIVSSPRRDKTKSKKSEIRVEIIVYRKLRDHVVVVKRTNDRIMALKIMVGDGIINIVGAYAQKITVRENFQKT